MPRQTTIKLLRTTKTNLDAQKAISNLIVGEPYFITDNTSKLALATAVNDYETYYNSTEVDTKLLTKADTTHNHSLDNLSEKSYNSLTDKPTLFSGSYADLTNKPITFTPSAHTQAISTIDGLQTALDGKSATTHNHTLSSLSEKSYNSLTDKPTIPTNFDSLYYTKSEVDTKLNVFTRSTGLTSLTIDCSTADIYEIEVSTNTAFVVTNVPTNKERKFIITNSGAGDITITYPNTADYWESATFTIGAGKKKVTALEYNGTTRFWYLSTELKNA